MELIPDINRKRDAPMCHLYDKPDDVQGLIESYRSTLVQQ